MYCYHRHHTHNQATLSNDLNERTEALPASQRLLLEDRTIHMVRYTMQAFNLPTTPQLCCLNARKKRIDTLAFLQLDLGKPPGRNTKHPLNRLNDEIEGKIHKLQSRISSPGFSRDPTSGSSPSPFSSGLTTIVGVGNALSVFSAAAAPSSCSTALSLVEGRSASSAPSCWLTSFS